MLIKDVSAKEPAKRKEEIAGNINNQKTFATHLTSPRKTRVYSGMLFYQNVLV